MPVVRVYLYFIDGCNVNQNGEVVQWERYCGFSGALRRDVGSSPAFSRSKFFVRLTAIVTFYSLLKRPLKFLPDEVKETNSRLGRQDNGPVGSSSGCGSRFAHSGDAINGRRHQQ